MGTDSNKELNDEYLLHDLPMDEIKVHEIWVIANGRVMGMVGLLFCGSIMTMDKVMEKVPKSMIVNDNETERM